MIDAKLKALYYVVCNNKNPFRIKDNDVYTAWALAWKKTDGWKEHIQYKDKIIQQLAKDLKNNRCKT